MRPVAAIERKLLQLVLLDGAADYPASPVELNQRVLDGSRLLVLRYTQLRVERSGLSDALLYLLNTDVGKSSLTENDGVASERQTIYRVSALSGSYRAALKPGRRLDGSNLSLRDTMALAVRNVPGQRGTVGLCEGNYGKR